MVLVHNCLVLAIKKKTLQEPQDDIEASATLHSITSPRTSA